MVLKVVTLIKEDFDDDFSNLSGGESRRSSREKESQRGAQRGSIQMGLMAPIRLETLTCFPVEGRLESIGLSGFACQTLRSVHEIDAMDRGSGSQIQQARSTNSIEFHSKPCIE